jgi:UDP-glucose 4-epimerase
MNIIVTGGAGFIGSHVVDKLIQKKHNVMVIDNISTGKIENVNNKAVFVKKSILDNLSNEFNEFKPEAVFHLAAQVNLRVSLNQPFTDAQTNILGTVNILESCRKHDVKKIIYSSSVAVYGEPKELPVNEKHTTYTVSPYGTSKLCAEKYIELYKKTYGLENTILRYSNVYGPRQNILGEAGVITIFINNLLANKKCNIFGTGSQTRDFVYVDDVAEANVLALEKSNGIINIGTQTQTDINKLYKNISELTGSNQKPLYQSSVKGEVMKFVVNTSKAEKELGWTAHTELRKGLEKTVEWYKH